MSIFFRRLCGNGKNYFPRGDAPAPAPARFPKKNADAGASGGPRIPPEDQQNEGKQLSSRNFPARRSRDGKYPRPPANAGPSPLAPNQSRRSAEVADILLTRNSAMTAPLFAAGMTVGKFHLVFRPGIFFPRDDAPASPRMAECFRVHPLPKKKNADAGASGPRIPLADRRNEEITCEVKFSAPVRNPTRGMARISSDFLSIPFPRQLALMGQPDKRQDSACHWVVVSGRNYIIIPAECQIFRIPSRWSVIEFLTGKFHPRQMPVAVRSRWTRPPQPTRPDASGVSQCHSSLSWARFYHFQPELSNFTQTLRFLASSRRLRQLRPFAPDGNSISD